MDSISKSRSEITGNLEIVFGDVVLGVHGDGFEYLFSYQTGGLESLVVKGREWLYRTPKPTFWRATTDNDRGSGFSLLSAMWMGADLFLRTTDIRVWVDEQEFADFLPPGNNRFGQALVAESLKIVFVYETATVPKTKVETQYTVDQTGRIRVDVHYYGKRNCRILFFSSDAVFGDDSGVIYDEESITVAHTPYGRMKKAVEDEFKTESLFKAIRLSYVASARDRFITYCINCIKNGERADIFHPFYRNVITVSDVVNIVLYLIFYWDEYEPKFLNAAGQELVSRVRIADEINRFFGGKLKYSISMPGEDFFSNRPCITQMKSLYMQKYGIIKDNTFTEKIAKELEDINL